VKPEAGRASAVVRMLARWDSSPPLFRIVVTFGLVFASVAGLSGGYLAAYRDPHGPGLALALSEAGTGSLCLLGLFLLVAPRKSLAARVAGDARATTLLPLLLWLAFAAAIFGFIVRAFWRVLGRG
jgi:hypothetical protein